MKINRLRRVHGHKPRRTGCDWVRGHDYAPVTAAVGAMVSAVFTILIWYHQMRG